jgi:hypothetical protein
MSQFGFCRRTAVESLLDLDIACFLVVDDRRMDLICCFLDEIWFVLGVV